MDRRYVGIDLHRRRSVIYAMELADAYLVRVESLRDLIDVYDREVIMLERRIYELLRDDRGYQAIQALDGVGRTIAAIFVTEIGVIHRFRSPEALCSPAQTRRALLSAVRSPRAERGRISNVRQFRRVLLGEICVFAGP
jgi:transposase